MWPNLDEAPSGDDPCLLSASQHLPDEMAQLGGEQEPWASHREGHQAMNGGSVQGGVCKEHGQTSLIAGDSYLPASRWAPVDGKGVSPFEDSVTWRQPVVGHDGLQAQPLSDPLLVSSIEYDSLVFNHRSHDGLCGALDVAHPTLVAYRADTLHSKFWCVLPAPFLMYVYLGTFRPSFMKRPNDITWARRRRLGPRQDLGRPPRDKMLHGGRGLATEDASLLRW